MRIRVLLMTLLMCCGVPFLAAAAQEDAPEQAMLGDLNRDGSCDIRDVQAMICQALQVREQVREADLDENGAVNIFDVQSGINTALETAGLVRRVRGRVEAKTPCFRAGCRCGRFRTTGNTRRATSTRRPGIRAASAREQCVERGLFADHNGQGQQQTGTLEIPVGEKASCLVPLAGLSHGGELDLGNLQFQERIRATRDMRTMFAHMNRWMFQNDSDGDGIPDFCAPLLTRAQEGPGVPQAMRQGEGLAVYVAPCVTEWLEQITEVSLTDADEDGIPDFVAPLIDCIESSLDEWFAGHGQPMPGNGDQGANFVANLIAYVVDGIPEWLANLDSPDVIDADGDGIPDYLEPLLREPGGPNAVDTDGDGRPDFAQDADGDGIPNCLDDDFRCPNDCDGDAIPNADDRDQDNDGVPNYADAEPCNPDVH